MSPHAHPHTRTSDEQFTAFLTACDPDRVTAERMTHASRTEFRMLTAERDRLWDEDHR